jgi:hypothetical protein
MKLIGYLKKFLPNVDLKFNTLKYEGRKMKEDFNENLLQLKNDFKTGFFIPLSILVSACLIYALNLDNRVAVMFFIASIITGIMAYGTQKYIINAMKIKDNLERHNDVVKTYTTFSSFYPITLMLLAVIGILKLSVISENSSLIFFFICQCLFVIIIGKKHDPKVYFEKYKSKLENI